MGKRGSTALVLFFMGQTLLARAELPGQGKAEPATPWVEAASRLTGESLEVRLQSIALLKNMPKLDELLRQELKGPRQFLALDVIAALKLRTLLPDLLELSKNDESGFFYLCMNALVTPQNQQAIARTYYERLALSTASAKVVLLDTLFRMRMRLSQVELEHYLRKDPDLEVRKAALYYLRCFVVYFHDDEYLSTLKALLQQNALSPRFQIQALFVVSELPLALRRKFEGIHLTCSSELPADLRELCQSLAQRDRARPVERWAERGAS